jgi:hypothetical protein
VVLHGVVQALLGLVPCGSLQNDSLQQVHSWKWSHTTGGRGFFSSASTTAAIPDVLMPAAAAA